MLPTPTATQARVIVNPAAGGGRAHGPALRAAVGCLAEHGWTVSWRVTEGAGHAQALAAEATAAGIDVVVAAGGDGTVSEIVNGLAGSPTALAVLPAGTGNVLAAELGLIGIPTPLHRADLVAAAEALCAGAPRWVDLGFARSAGRAGRFFCLWAGVGLDAEVARLIEGEGRELKRRLGPAAYGAMGIKAAFAATGMPAVVECDERRASGRLLLAVVANVRLYGGAVVLAPEAQLDDGRLDVSLFWGRSLFSTVRHVGTVLLHRQGHRAEFESRPARHVSVTTDAALPVHLDAEPFGTTPVTVEVRPRSLRLIVPPAAPADLFTERSRAAP